MWTLKFFLHGQVYANRHESETKEDALTFGCIGEDADEFTMHSLIDPNGNVDMEYEDLRMYYIYEW
jgi:hypothetical protein